MAQIKNFEEILSWQKARVLANLIYNFFEKGAFARDYALRDQIQRACGSVMHNIAEGFEAGSKREFIRFLIYARRSAGEVQSQLYLALDRSYIDAAQFSRAYDLASEIKKLINGLISAIRKSL